MTRAPAPFSVTPGLAGAGAYFLQAPRPKNTTGPDQVRVDDESENFPMLEIKDLHATVADKAILTGLSLSVNAGEVHAIMGPEWRG